MTRTTFSMLVVVVSSLFISFTTAQSLIPNSIPSCAQQCAILQQAAQSCMSNQATAQSCFCQSSLLAAVKTNPSANICAPTCSEGDWTAVASWYSSTCANGGSSSSAGAPSTTLATKTTGGNGASNTNSIVAASGPAGTSEPSNDGSSSSIGGSSSGSQAASNGGTQSSDSGTNATGKAWWNTHYQWVIMVIVLLIVFTVLGVMGTIFYRRRQKNKARNRGSYSGGTAAQWAPNSSTHDFNQSTDRHARAVLAAKPNPLAGQEVEEKHQVKGKAKAVVGLLRKGTR